jgi:hypothetical protein
MMNVRSKMKVPQGLKPRFFASFSGTAEAVPFPNPFTGQRLERVRELTFSDVTVLFPGLPVCVHCLQHVVCGGMKPL